MLSILCRHPNMFSIGQQLIGPTRLIVRHNPITKTQKQCFKTSRGMGNRDQVVKRSTLPEHFQSRVFRASVSAVGGSLLFFGASTLWTYENLLRIRNLQKRFPFNQRQISGYQNPITKWWNSLRESQKLFAIIASLNLAVFLAWRGVPPHLQPIMYKYFTLNLASKHTFLPMLLSTFSHMGFLHLFFNMYCLNSFLPVLTTRWGKESTLAFYLSAGMFGSFASVLLKVYTKSLHTSLGASAAVLGIVASSCMMKPDLKVGIIFVPVYFPAQYALMGVITFDIAGIVMRWKSLDHAAHLGGTLFGVLFYTHGHKFYKEYCRKVAKAYNKIRASPT